MSGRKRIDFSRYVGMPWFDMSFQVSSTYKNFSAKFASVRRVAFSMQSNVLVQITWIAEWSSTYLNNWKRYWNPWVKVERLPCVSKGTFWHINPYSSSQTVVMFKRAVPANLLFNWQGRELPKGQYNSVSRLPKRLIPHIYIYRVYMIHKYFGIFALSAQICFPTKHAELQIWYRLH